MKKISNLVLLMAISTQMCFSQTTTTVAFKPGPGIGQDVALFALDQPECVLSGWTTPPAITNMDGLTEMIAADWTWSGQNCGDGTMRNLIRFDELASIPDDAIITSAELRLYGVGSSGVQPVGNNSYPGSPYPNTNPSWLRRVTSPWVENTVTWNTMPSFDTINQIPIPTTTAQWNWNYFTSTSTTTATTNLRNLVQFWVANPTQNYGLMFMLDTEINYRSVLFASSDHPNSNLWPELVVTYYLPCDANFTYGSSTNNPYLYDFTSTTTLPGAYQWYINGTNVSSAPSFSYTLPPGSHKVCLKFITDKKIVCEKCVEICVSRNEKGILKPERSVEDFTKVPPPIKGDMIDVNNLTVYPNPSNETWSVKFNSPNTIATTAELYDNMGKLVKKYKIQIIKGENTLEINGGQLESGVYLLKIKNGETILKEKLVKK